MGRGTGWPGAVGSCGGKGSSGVAQAPERAGSPAAWRTQEDYLSFSAVMGLCQGPGDG